MVKQPLASCMLGCFPDSYIISSLDSIVSPFRLLWLMEVFVSLVASYTVFGQHSQSTQTSLAHGGICFPGGFLHYVWTDYV